MRQVSVSGRGGHTEGMFVAGVRKGGSASYREGASVTASETASGTASVRAGETASETASGAASESASETASVTASESASETTSEAASTQTQTHHLPSLSSILSHLLSLSPSNLLSSLTMCLSHSFLPLLPLLCSWPCCAAL